MFRFAVASLGRFQVLERRSTPRVERVLPYAEVSRTVALSLREVGKAVLDGNSFAKLGPT